MAWLERSVVTLASSAALLLGGCSCETRPPPIPLDAMPPDAPRADAGPRPDTAGTDTFDPTVDAGFDFSRCVAMEPADRLLVDTETRSRPRMVAVAPAHDEWAIAYSRAEVGVPNVFWARVSTGPDAVVFGPATTGVFTSQDPAVVSTPDGWVLAWVNNESGSNELYARGFGNDAAPLAAVTRLTTNTLDESGPSLVRVGAQVLGAWLETSFDGTTRGLRTRLLSTTGAAAAATADIDTMGILPGRPNLATRLDGTAVAWATDDAIVMPLSATGGGGVVPTVVSAEGNASSESDLSLDAGGGAMVFDVHVDVRPEVRAILLGASGEVIGPERVLTVAPDAGGGASITAFAGGYAVAYRALESSPPILRVLFLNSNLDEVARMDVGEIEQGSRVTIRASGDGRLLVAWADASATRTDIRIARIRCE